MSAKDFETLVAACDVLAWGGPQMKVLTAPNGHLIKLFQLRPRPSSAWFYPYSLRFARNARRLNDMGITCLVVTRTFFVPRRGLHCAIYPVLQGDTLFELELSLELRRKLAQFVAYIHDKGLYFRALHLGNVLQLPSGEFGLIDVANARLYRRPLRNSERKRNLHHLFRREDNRLRFGEAGAKAFLEEYELACVDHGVKIDGLAQEMLPVWYP